MVGRLDFVDVDGKTVQGKVDRRIATSERIFFEFFKRNDGIWNSYGRPGGWHASLSAADRYIFVTDLLAIRIETDVLVELGLAKRASVNSGPFIVKPRGTALGAYISLAVLRGQPGVEFKAHKDKIPTDGDYDMADQILLWAEKRRPASPDAWR